MSEKIVVADARDRLIVNVLGYGDTDSILADFMPSRENVRGCQP